MSITRTTARAEWRTKDMAARWLVFKSIRGLDKPWLVFSPMERIHPEETQWDNGFASWQEAISFVLSCELAKGQN